MSRSLASSRRQSPSPAPVLPVSPLPALPSSRSSELKCFVSFAPMASVRVSYSAVRVVERRRWSPRRTSSAWLTTRRNPWRPFASDADGNSGTECSPSVSLSGAADRFVRCPVGLDSRLIATMSCSDRAVSRHLPEPSPIDPVSPLGVARLKLGRRVGHGTNVPRARRSRPRAGDRALVVGSRDR